MDKPPDIDAYLAGVPEDARVTLEDLRRTVRELVPDAVETISYGMPTFKYRGKWLFYFAAATKHCAIYGTPGARCVFRRANRHRGKRLRRCSESASSRSKARRLRARNCSCRFFRPANDATAIKPRCRAIYDERTRRSKDLQLRSEEA
jgi:hypothetical protein